MKKRLFSILLAVAVMLSLTIITDTQIGHAAADGFKSIAAGDSHSMAVTQDGGLWIWGDNRYGQLGNGTVTRFTALTAATDHALPEWMMDNVAFVAAANLRSYAILTDGSLLTWGTISQVEGAETDQIRRLNPEIIFDNVIYVTGGSHHTAAIREDGSLWVWGSNRQGQLGDGTTIYRHDPIKVMDEVVAVAAGGSHTLAIKPDGSLWAFGLNRFGQIGNGESGNNFDDIVITPVKIMENVIAVSAGGNHSVALQNDGSLWTWGSNVNGALGEGANIGEQVSRNVPAKILENVASVSVGGRHVIKEDGSLWHWGGTVATLPRAPFQMQMEGAVLVNFGGLHSLAARTDGSLWAWGNRQYGQLGDGTAAMQARNTPAEVNFEAAAPDVIRVTIDGNRVTLDQAPIIEGGRTLIPIRPVAEAIGADISWNQATQTSTLSRAGVTVNLTIGSTTAQVNDENVTLDAAPIILNGRTLLPVRFVAETFSQDVQWNPQSRVIAISEDMTFAEGSNIAEWLLGAGAIMARVNERTGSDPYLEVSLHGTGLE